MFIYFPCVDDFFAVSNLFGVAYFTSCQFFSVRYFIYFWSF